MIVSTDLYVILVIRRVYTKEKLPSVLSQTWVAKNSLFQEKNVKVFESTIKAPRAP